MNWNTSISDIIKLVEEEFMTLEEIAQVIGCSRQNVSTRLKHAGYQLRKAPHKGRDNHTLTQPKLLKQLLEESLHWEDAGRKTGVSRLVVINWAKFHNIKHTFVYKGRAAPNWLKGSHLDKKTGYLWINTYESGYGAFNPNWGNHQVHQHKAIFEIQVLGFPLIEGYCVHHIDEDRINNNIDNLTLLEIGEHIHFHNVLNQAKEMTEGNTAWRNVVLQMLNTVVKAMSSANIKKLKMRKLLEDAALDEIATISNEESQKAWKKRKYHTADELWEILK